MMGAGKSRIGRQLASRLAVPFCDLDLRIARAAGHPAGEHLERVGEERFRADETAALERVLAETPPGVLALGGGCFCRADNRELLSRHGARTLWLRVAPEVLLQRVSSSFSLRPLAPVDLAGWRALCAEREPHYAMADHVIDPDSLGSTRTLEELLRWVGQG
jgi:shikimate kinase